MLVSLSIKNYALIENLKVEFKDELSIITGETGAGKSILMGGLALVLGKRADSSLVYDKEKKCVIEAEFEVGAYQLDSFFEKHDLDYDACVIIRREILPNGKSRAFVNDTPTNLSVLNILTSQLIDIHSQHETLQLADPSYQFNIIDAVAENSAVLTQYEHSYSLYKASLKELQIFKEQQQQAKNEYDYNVFLWEELDAANLTLGEQENLEKDLDKLSHAEEIKLNLSGIMEISERESLGALGQLQDIDQHMSRIRPYADLYASLSERVKSLIIEFKDLLYEVSNENEKLIYDPAALQEVEDRLHTIYDLEKKHGAQSVEELISTRELYKSKISDVDGAEDAMAKLENKILGIKNDLNKISSKLHKRRVNAIPQFISQIESALGNLEMKNTRFKVSLSEVDEFLSNGKDKMEFLLSSDKGKSFESMKKVASGGEMSRLMLAVKCILSNYSNLPAIIFDEIDTGVSGEVSNKIAEVMLAMSQNMQVITITHLPQVAAKGQHHYKVYKEEHREGVSSNIKLLNQEERLVELAEMLGGNRITDSAMAHARQLLS